MPDRVYHFILDPRVGGPHVYAQSVIRALSKQFDGIIVTSGRGPVTEIALLNLRHWWRPLYLLEVPLNVCLLLWLAAMGRMQTHRSIFDVHGAANLAPIIAAWILRVPVVWHFHETAVEFRRFASIGMRFLPGLPHRLAVVAEKCAAVFNLQDYVVLPGAIDLAYWWASHGEYRHAAQDGFNLVAVGNLNPLKGHDVLLEALSALPGRWTLYVVGAELENQGDFAAGLREKAERLMRQHPDCRIVFTGWQDSGAIRHFLDESDVFVLPSRSEACPIVLLEAMAMGCICVATDVGAVSEIVRPESGYVVSPNDPEALRLALLAAWEMSEEQKSLMSRAARGDMESRFSLEAMGAKHLELYRSLL